MVVLKEDTHSSYAANIYLIGFFFFFSPFVISKLVTVCHLLMATNQEFFCRRQLRSMTSCSLPIKLLNCWSLSKDNFPEGKSQDVTMTCDQSLHKTEHGINNFVKIEGRFCTCSNYWTFPEVAILGSDENEVVQVCFWQGACYC